MSSSDKGAFLKVFDQLKDELIGDFDSLPGLSDDLKLQLKEYYGFCLGYTVPGGKMTRGLTVVKGVEVLKGRTLTESEFFDAAVLGWQVEWLQAFFLVADDIMDASITRRGSPCWYKQPHVTQDNGINDALFLENLIYKSLRRHFRSHPAYVTILELFIDTTFRTEVGQHIDTNGTPYADGKRAPLDLSRFTLDRYRGCVRYKTSYYSFYVSCALALAYCGYDPETSDLYKKVRFRERWRHIERERGGGRGGGGGPPHRIKPVGFLAFVSSASSHSFGFCSGFFWESIPPIRYFPHPHTPPLLSPSEKKFLRPMRYA